MLPFFIREYTLFYSFFSDRKFVNFTSPEWKCLWAVAVCTAWLNTTLTSMVFWWCDLPASLRCAVCVWPRGRFRSLSLWPPPRKRWATRVSFEWRRSETRTLSLSSKVSSLYARVRICPMLIFSELPFFLHGFVNYVKGTVVYIRSESFTNVYTLAGFLFQNICYRLKHGIFAMHLTVMQYLCAFFIH